MSGRFQEFFDNARIKHGVPADNFKIFTIQEYFGETIKCLIHQISPYSKRVIGSWTVYNIPRAYRVDDSGKSILGIKSPKGKYVTDANMNCFACYSHKDDSCYVCIKECQCSNLSNLAVDILHYHKVVTSLIVADITSGMTMRSTDEYKIYDEYIRTVMKTVHGTEIPKVTGIRTEEIGESVSYYEKDLVRGKLTVVDRIYFDNNEGANLDDRHIETDSYIIDVSSMSDNRKWLHYIELSDGSGERSKDFINLDNEIDFKNLAFEPYSEYDFSSYSIDTDDDDTDEYTMGMNSMIDAANRL